MQRIITLVVGGGVEIQLPVSVLALSNTMHNVFVENPSETRLECPVREDPMAIRACIDFMSLLSTHPEERAASPDDSLRDTPPTLAVWEQQWVWQVMQINDETAEALAKAGETPRVDLLVNYMARAQLLSTIADALVVPRLQDVLAAVEAYPIERVAVTATSVDAAEARIREMFGAPDDMTIDDRAAVRAQFAFAYLRPETPHILMPCVKIETVAPVEPMQ